MIEVWMALAAGLALSVGWIGCDLYKRGLTKKELAEPWADAAKQLAKEMGRVRDREAEMMNSLRDERAQWLRALNRPSRGTKKETGQVPMAVWTGNGGVTMNRVTRDDPMEQAIEDMMHATGASRETAEHLLTGENVPAGDNATIDGLIAGELKSRTGLP